MNMQMEQDALDEVCEDHVVVFWEELYFANSYPLINKFDGKVCDFQFPEGGGNYRVLPISTGKHKAVTITLMDGWVEYKITDDWNKKHYLYIRSSESEVIFKSVLSYKEKYGIIPVLK